MNLFISANGIARYGEKIYRVAIGREGVTPIKTEGDGASPAGTYRLCRAFYRADRVLPPETPLQLTKITSAQGWCDAPTDPNYNSLVTLPYNASCEALYRADTSYNILITTDHNTNPVVASAGSAIFVHISDGEGYEPTAGCVAFSESDLREILSGWNQDTDRLTIGFNFEAQK